MVMRRKITEILKKWKASDASECALLIDGARRVGKSFIVEEFAKAEYPAYLKSARMKESLFLVTCHDRL